MIIRSHKSLGLAGVALLFWILGIQAGLGQRARIKFKQEVVDVGKLQVGEVAEYVFEYVNEGNAPLKIFETWGD